MAAQEEIGMTAPDPLKALMILDGAKSEERTTKDQILAGSNYDKMGTLYEQTGFRLREIVTTHRHTRVRKGTGQQSPTRRKRNQKQEQPGKKRNRRTEKT